MKYDINLMPKNNDKSAIQTVIISLLLLLIIIGGLGYFCYYMPVQERNHLKADIKDLEDELASSSDLEQEYIELSDKVSKLLEIEIKLKNLKENNIKTTEIYDGLEKSIPKNITLDKIVLDEGGIITIEGYSPTHTDIAQFLVNLRKVDKVLVVEFQMLDNNNPKKPNEFTIQLAWNVITMNGGIQ